MARINLFREYSSEIVGGLVVAFFLFVVAYLREALALMRVVVLVIEVVSIAVLTYILTAKKRSLVIPNPPQPRFKSKVRSWTKLSFVFLTTVASLVMV